MNVMIGMTVLMVRMRETTGMVSHCSYKHCTGSDVCYAKLNECDGMNDCPYGEDERYCWDGKSLFLQALAQDLTCFMLNITLPMPTLLSHKDAKIFENHLNPVMLVFIG